MDLENSISGDDLKSAILADSHLFLISLESGASEELLMAILDRIRQLDLQLILEEGLRLTPEIWNILRSRMANRKGKEIIDMWD